MQPLYRRTNVRHLMIRCSCVLLCLLGAALLAHAQQSSGRVGVLLSVSDAIGPATGDYIHRGLKEARERNAAVVILQLDTPGGLDTAMRSIIQDIIASPVPVITWVAPSGARAASAGTYMLYASHVAAMAPGTNLGAATPVQLGGGMPEFNPPSMPKPQSDSQSENADEPGKGNNPEPVAKSDAAKPDAMQQKVLNDSIAYIRSLAEMRDRNVEWAEQAVREASSISAARALDIGVIDLVATDIGRLLVQIDGKQVSVNGVERTLNTANLVIESIEPDWRNELLSVITNPNVAYILMLLGIYGLFFEFVNPGFVLPGVIGATSLILALYALQVLPVNYAGVALIVLGIIFMVAEVFAPSFGALGIGGVVAFVAGSVILFDTEGSNLQIALPLIIAVSGVTAGFTLIVVRMVIAAHRKPVVSGVDEMVGSVGEAQQDFNTTGHILVHGETWQANIATNSTSTNGARPVKRGDKVKVVAIDGLTLTVKPL